MKDYYMFTFDDTKKIPIGKFDSDKSFWKFYWENEIFIKKAQFKLEKNNQLWYMTSY